MDLCKACFCQAVNSEVKRKWLQNHFSRLLTKTQHRQHRLRHYCDNKKWELSGTAKAFASDKA